MRSRDPAAGPSSGAEDAGAQDPQAGSVDSVFSRTCGKIPENANALQASIYYFSAGTIMLIL